MSLQVLQKIHSDFSRKGENMQHYRNIGGNSNVNSYAIGDTYLDVLFYGTPRVYRYSYKSAGVENVENMKVLAEQGYGLNSFINRYVKYKYER